MNCMEILSGQDEICPHCNESTNRVQPAPFMPEQTIIADRYIVGKGLEINGEGLSYIGFDISKKSKVYIREFYPSNLCSRLENLVNVKIQNNCEKFFKNSLAQFLKYFRSVARLRNLSSIVSIYDIIEKNGTAYIICEWVQGQRLSKYLGNKGGYLEWDDARLMFLPLISSLSRMHSAGIRHLGICPDNIIVNENDELKLTGFATANLYSAGSVINDQLHDGCSALEQYLEHYEPSESTDVYGLAASLFLTLTGEYPPAATEREKRDRLMISQSLLASLPENVVSALATALRIKQNSRTISFEVLKMELLDSPVARIKNLQDYSDESYDNSNFKNKKNAKSSGYIWGMISCGIAIVVLLAGLGVYWFWLRDNVSYNKSEINATENSSKSDEVYEETVTDKIPVPSFIERNLENLQSELALNSEYKIIVLSEEFHDSIGEGCIISQTPSPGEEMDKGGTIAVNISKGSKSRILPEITGKTLSEAAKLITNAKLIPKAINSTENNSEFGEGIVIGYHNKQAGDTVDYGTEVTIIVSKG